MSKVKILKVIDTVKERKKKFSSTDESMEVLWAAQGCHTSMQPLMEKRRRCYRYYNGDQWKDKIEVSPGEWITEEEYMWREGELPVTNNLINRLVNTHVGVYRSQLKEPTCVARDRNKMELGTVMSTVLQCNWQRNCMTKINAKTFKEYLISGMAIHRKWYGFRSPGCDVWTDYVNPESFFVDSIMRDLRGWDATMMGMIHDHSFEELCREYAITSEDYEELAEEYAVCRDRAAMGSWYGEFGFENHDYSFFTPNDPNVCRVFEIWKKELKSRYHCHDYLDGSEYKIEANDYYAMIGDENQKRIQMALEAGEDPEVVKVVEELIINEANGKNMGAYAKMYQEKKIPASLKLITARPFSDDYWYFYMLTPTGKILREGECPYKHGRPPFVFTFNDFLNGEVHSFVENIIPEQHYYNQLLAQKNMIIRASAKGALMIGKRAMKGRGEKYYADRWSRPRSVMVYDDTQGGTMPQQVNSVVNTNGIDAMIAKMESNMENGSGVHGAVQGRAGTTGTSGVLYAQQAQNSTMTMLDALDSFNEFLEDGAMMDVKLIQQYYTDKDTFNIVGKSDDGVVWEPSVMKDIIFDLAIGESTATPAYRQLAQDRYDMLLQNQVITGDEYLEFSDIPNADAILQKRKQRMEEEQQMQQQQMAAQGGAPTEEEDYQPPTVQVSPNKYSSRMMRALQATQYPNSDQGPQIY